MHIPPQAFRQFPINDNIYDWHYVSSQTNPADLISMGLTPQFLISCYLCWSGPEWMLTDKISWPKIEIYSLIDLSEVKETTKLIVSSNECKFPFELYDTFLKLCNYVIRFIHNCRNQKSRLAGILNAKQLATSKFHSGSFLKMRVSQTKFLNVETVYN